MKHCLKILLVASAIGTAAIFPATAQNSAANNSYKPGDPVFVDTAKILENAAARQQQQQQQDTVAISGVKEAAPREVLAQEIQSLKVRSDICLDPANCSVKERVKLLRSMSNAMSEAFLRFDGVCDLMSYNGCITAQRADLEEWFVMNDRMKILMQTLAPVETKNLLLSANPAAELNSIQPAAGDPLAGAPPTVP
jgi:hypothetical protein